MRCHIQDLCLVLIAGWTTVLYGLSVEAPVHRYGVHEIVFHGPNCSAKDNPVRDIELVTEWRHESGDRIRVWGFYDGDGRGGIEGNVFKVRFCPPRLGKWWLHAVRSNDSKLNGQHCGDVVKCLDSTHPGFWLVDPDTQGRWYRRSDGSHPYIIGNTMYTFLSECGPDGPTGGNIADDVHGNSEYFKKIRFSIAGGRYPHPQDKPFLDEAGKPTDDGDWSHRPNPAWFSQRVDLAVKTAYEHDVIADLILNGPDTVESRSILRAQHNDGDATPILQYMAARYGSFPNVWFCLANEFDIKTPKYTTEQAATFGRILREHLPYPMPVSIHARPRDWYRELNRQPAWHDHVIIQKKLKALNEAADWVSRNHAIGGGVPVIDDELAYEGKGDGWSEADVIESHLGAFLGGGYGTTGHKPAAKQGHYFWGHFKAEEHHAADNLKWLREQIDTNIRFWKLQPVAVGPTEEGRTNVSIFRRLDPRFRVLEWPGHEYVLGTNRRCQGMVARLPSGQWRIVHYDVIKKQRQVVAASTSGDFRFDSPNSRAVLLHFRRIEP